MGVKTPYLVLDIETFADVRPDRLDHEGNKAAEKAQAKLDELTRKGNAVKAPVSYKDPKKIEDYMVRERTKFSNQIKKQTVNVAADIQDAKDAFLDKAALSPMTGRIVAVGLGIRTVGGGWEHAVFVDRNNREAEMLASADRAISEIGYASLITWNGRKFDLPFLVARSMRAGLKLKHKWPMGYSDRHLDLFDLIAGGRQNQFGGSLKLWVREILGKDRKATGADVAELVNQKKWDEMAAYCQEDVEDTARLFELYEATAHLTRR